MKEKFDGKLSLKIFTLDSEDAKGYMFKGSTNVLFQNDWVPLDVATDTNKMEHFLSQKLRQDEQ